MEIKYSLDFSKNHTVKTVVSGVLLGILGLLIVFDIYGLGWIQTLSHIKLSAYIILTLLVGTCTHEIYHQFIAQLMGHASSMEGFPALSFPPLDDLTKWEALGIKLAPALDLTLISGLIIAFLPSPLSPILSIFLIGNLAGSANDMLQSYYIYKLASHNSRIRLTESGFQIRE